LSEKARKGLLRPDNWFGNRKNGRKGFLGSGEYLVWKIERKWPNF
jgi:hypothetical protein